MFDCARDPFGCALDSVNDWFVDLLRSMAESVARLAFGWWIDVGSVVPSASNVPLRGQMTWLALAIVTAGIMAIGIRIVMTRRGEPLMDGARGLWAVGIASGASIFIMSTLVRAMDRWAVSIMDGAVDGVGDELVTILGLTNVTNPGLIVIGAIVVGLAGLVQAGLMLLRDPAVLILTGMLPLAAAGQLVGFGRQWLPKVVGWLLALVCYKPMAALVYYSAFQLLDAADAPREFLVALAAMGLSIVALPAMMKLFSWTTGAVAAGSGGGGLLAAGAAGMGAVAMARGAGAVRQPGGSGAAAATALNQSLGPAGGPGPGGTSRTRPSGASTSRPPAPTSGAASAGGSAAGGVAAKAGAAVPVAMAVQSGVQAAGAVKDVAADAATGDGDGR